MRTEYRVFVSPTFKYKMSSPNESVDTTLKDRGTVISPESTMQELGMESTITKECSNYIHLIVKTLLLMDSIPSMTKDVSSDFLSIACPMRMIICGPRFAIVHFETNLSTDCFF